MPRLELKKKASEASFVEVEEKASKSVLNRHKTYQSLVGKKDVIEARKRINALLPNLPSFRSTKGKLTNVKETDLSFAERDLAEEMAQALLNKSKERGRRNMISDAFKKNLEKIIDNT